MPDHSEASETQSAPTRVFVSATSKDLGSVRELVKQVLLTIGCTPVEQTDLPSDYRGVREILEDRIAGCEAVIHIVGMRYGVEPDPSTIPEGAVRCSCTQMELEIARKLGKKLYVFVCSEGFPYDAAAETEIPDMQALQRSYREQLTGGEIQCSHVGDREAISRKVRELPFEPEKIKRGKGLNWRRVMTLLGALAMVLVAVGASLWYLVSPERQRDGRP